MGKLDSDCITTAIHASTVDDSSPHTRERQRRREREGQKKETLFRPADYILATCENSTRTEQNRFVRVRHLQRRVILWYGIELCCGIFVPGGFAKMSSKFAKLTSFFRRSNVNAEQVVAATKVQLWRQLYLCEMAFACVCVCVCVRCSCVIHKIRDERIFCDNSQRHSCVGQMNNLTLKRHYFECVCVFTSDKSNMPYPTEHGLTLPNSLIILFSLIESISDQSSAPSSCVNVYNQPKLEWSAR